MSFDMMRNKRNNFEIATIHLKIIDYKLDNDNHKRGTLYT